MLKNELVPPTTILLRFVKITDEELIELVEEHKNPNTKRKTAYTLSYSRVSFSNKNQE